MTNGQFTIEYIPFKVVKRPEMRIISLKNRTIVNGGERDTVADSNEPARRTECCSPCTDYPIKHPIMQYENIDWSARSVLYCQIVSLFSEAKYKRG